MIFQFRQALMGLGLLAVGLSGCSGHGAATSALPGGTSTLPQSGDRLPQSITPGWLNSLAVASLHPTDAGRTVLAQSTLTKLASVQSRGTESLVTASTAVQTVGVNVIPNPGTNITAMYAQHTAYAATSYSIPKASNGNANAVFAPLSNSPGACLSPSSLAQTYGDGSGTYSFFIIIDWCHGPSIVFSTQIDANFVSNYTFPDSAGLPAYATLVGTTDQIPSATSTWFALLYNPKSQSWDRISDTIHPFAPPNGGTSLIYPPIASVGLNPGTKTANGQYAGYSVFQTVYQPGACPINLPFTVADGLQVYKTTAAATSTTPGGQWQLVTPTIAGATYAATSTANPALPCFTADTTGPSPYSFIAGGTQLANLYTPILPTAQSFGVYSLTTQTLNAQSGGTLNILPSGQAGVSGSVTYPSFSGTQGTITAIFTAAVTNTSIGIPTDANGGFSNITPAPFIGGSQITGTPRVFANAALASSNAADTSIQFGSSSNAAGLTISSTNLTPGTAYTIYAIVFAKKGDFQGFITADGYYSLAFTGQNATAGTNGQGTISGTQVFNNVPAPLGRAAYILVTGP